MWQGASHAISISKLAVPRHLPYRPITTRAHQQTACCALWMAHLCAINLSVCVCVCDILDVDNRPIKRQMTTLPPLAYPPPPSLSLSGDCFTFSWCKFLIGVASRLLRFRIERALLSSRTHPCVLAFLLHHLPIHPAEMPQLVFHAGCRRT